MAPREQLERLHSVVFVQQHQRPLHSVRSVLERLAFCVDRFLPAIWQTIASLAPFQTMYTPPHCSRKCTVPLCEVLTKRSSPNSSRKRAAQQQSHWRRFESQLGSLDSTHTFVRCSAPTCPLCLLNRVQLPSTGHFLEIDCWVQFSTSLCRFIGLQRCFCEQMSLVGRCPPRLHRFPTFQFCMVAK